MSSAAIQIEYYTTMEKHNRVENLTEKKINERLKWDNKIFQDENDGMKTTQNDEEGEHIFRIKID